MDQDKAYCQFERINKCQGDGSGGHPGTIRSLSNGFCAKTTRSEKGKEVIFYQNHQNHGYRALDKFIPQFGGFCLGPESHKKYIAVENIKDGFEEPWEIDIKIGLRSASRTELKDRMGLFKRGLKKRIHILMDNYFSTTGQFGFRVENFSRDDPVEKKLESKTMRPHDVFKSYFKYDSTGQILKNFIRKMEEFYRLVMEDDFDPYFLIASSLLFVYDKKNAENKNYNVAVKMIDFDHSNVVDISKLKSDNKHFLRVNEYRYGIMTLVKELKYFYVDLDPGKSLFKKSTFKSKKSKKTKENTNTKKKGKHNIIEAIRKHKKRFKSQKKLKKNSLKT